MEDSNSSEPPRCPCGFWGSSETSGLCSKCYKDLRKPSVPQPTSALRSTMDSAPHSSRTNPENLSKKNSKAEELQIPNGENPKDLSNFKGNVCDKHSDSAGSCTAQCELSSDKKSPSECTSPQKCETKHTAQEGQECSSSQSSSDVTLDGNRGTKRDNSVLSDDSESSPKKPNMVQKNKKRCYKCSCKLELAQRAIGRCRCGLVFCPLHRLPELHECEFDHKEEGREKAREKMVKPTRHLGTSFRRLESDS
ncbi:AN1-type zinc finger protein 3 homolog [Haliotis rubra]|uniref:AN1-type zinc finger protein 3 homolog n=1 Tax=Haliotis rubra TaxID=36100 RepID=UPI001EE5BEB1|nr:AN1-type zinc finger protein 3 homolog [Haliotis rubra]